MHRRLVILIALLALLASAAPANSGVRTDRRANAVFYLEERKGDTPFIFVIGDEMSTARYSFAIGRGTCRPDRKPECVIDRDTVRARELREGEVFEIDPQLDSAHLRIEAGGRTHQVTWTASGLAGPLGFDGDCHGVSANRAGVRRTASATGRVFGLKLDTSRSGSNASLSAAAYAC